MNKLTIEQIKNKYPILNKKNSLKCGFSVENGWLRLIDKLSGFIESQIKDLSNEDKDKIYVTQIKNKFGGLRYYLNFPEKYYPDIQYKIDGENLVIWRTKIPIQSIHKVYRTRMPLSSPALSLDRIGIVYNKYDEIFISPKEREEFIKELLKVNPTIEVKD